MKTALLVIDVQHGLFDKEPRPLEAAGVIDRINALTDSARASDCPVVFIQHERESSPLAYDSVNWQLARDIKTADDDQFVRKTTPDSFLRTGLHELLQAKGVDHLVISGYACEFCVDTTTRRAAGLGYAVTIASDAHTTHDKAHASALSIREHENATLPNLTSFGPKITATPSADIRFAEPGR